MVGVQKIQAHESVGVLGLYVYTAPLRSNSYETDCKACIQIPVTALIVITLSPRDKLIHRPRGRPCVANVCNVAGCSAAPGLPADLCRCRRRADADVGYA